MSDDCAINLFTLTINNRIRDNKDDSEVFYALRFSGPAQRNIAEAGAHLATISGSAVADDWQDGLLEAVRFLIRSPKAYPVASVSRFFGHQVRQLRYQRRVGSVSYYIFYIVSDSGDDGPVVKIIHVRHASRKPLTRSESQEIAKEL